MTTEIERLESSIVQLLKEEANNVFSAEPREDEQRISEIESLTNRLVDESDYAPSTVSYTHSVCHLFGEYGVKLISGFPASYLNSPKLLPVAERLVNATLQKALESRNFLCVDRIVAPIVSYNLDHNTGDGSFPFKPTILSDPKFIEAYSRSRKSVEKTTRLYWAMQDTAHTVDFCRAQDMDEFYAKYVENLREAMEVKQVESDSDSTLHGIYVDVEGTLIKKKAIDPDLHTYLLGKMEEGTPVVVFTGGDPNEQSTKLKELGADARLQDVRSKSEYLGKTLEICIDDTNPSRQGFRAERHYCSLNELLSE